MSHKTINMVINREDLLSMESRNITKKYLAQIYWLLRYSRFVFIPVGSSCPVNSLNLFQNVQPEILVYVSIRW